MNLTQLKLEVNSILANLKDNDPCIDKIYEFIKELPVVNNKFLKYISDPVWVNAVDPIQICRRDSEEEKDIRGTIISGMFLGEEITNSFKPKNTMKILDFGSGEGYVAKHISNFGIEVYSYDIKDENKCNNINFTTSFEEVNKNKYDFVLLHDVLDHSVEEDPVEVLKKIRNILKEDGKVILRCHPWSSRHGTHLWSLNKAYAHLFLTDEELDKLGHKGIPTIKITQPLQTYRKWIFDSGLKIISESPKQKPCGIFIENGFDGLKEHLIKLIDNFEYSKIETDFVDYILMI